MRLGYVLLDGLQPLLHLGHAHRSLPLPLHLVQRVHLHDIRPGLVLHRHLSGRVLGGRLLVHRVHHVRRAPLAHHRLPLHTPRPHAHHGRQGAHRAQVQHQDTQVEVVESVRHSAAAVVARQHTIAQALRLRLLALRGLRRAHQAGQNDARAQGNQIIFIFSGYSCCICSFSCILLYTFCSSLSLLCPTMLTMTTY